MAEHDDIQHRTCKQLVDDEVKFILAGVERVNQEFEEKLRESGLDQYNQGEYSTRVFLDNSIRKYRLKLIDEVEGYRTVPYQSAHANSSQKTCISQQLQLDAVNYIHAFEVEWQQVLAKAEQNRNFFSSIDLAD